MSSIQPLISTTPSLIQSVPSCFMLSSQSFPVALYYSLLNSIYAKLENQCPLYLIHIKNKE